VSPLLYYLAGWIDVGAAKQFPSLTARGSAVHFIEQSQLRSMDDLQNFLETGLGNWVTQFTKPEFE
jgi:hypothetical protein